MNPSKSLFRAIGWTEKRVASKIFRRFFQNWGRYRKTKTKFYLHWVRRFLKSCNYQLDNINADRVSQYLDSLDADEKIADWQVKQAADAVILYVEKYLKRPLQQITALAEDPRAKSIDPKGSLPFRLGPFLLCVSQIEGILDQFDLFSLGSEENGNHIEPRLYIFEAFLL